MKWFTPWLLNVAMEYGHIQEVNHRQMGNSLWQTVKLPEGMFGAAPCEVQQISARLQTGAASSDAGLEKEVRGVYTMHHGVEDIPKRSKQPWKNGDTWW